MAAPSRRSPGRGLAGSARAVRLVVSTAPARDASRIARTLVDEGLAACVSLLGGLRSTYRWKGRVESANEVLLVAKTTAGRSRACLARLAQAHPYEVPEGIVVAPSEGLVAYLRWVTGSVT
jgi:periplasmic divalent cation tolerance protein